MCPAVITKQTPTGSPPNARSSRVQLPHRSWGTLVRPGTTPAKRGGGLGLLGWLRMRIRRPGMVVWKEGRECMQVLPLPFGAGLRRSGQ